MHIQDLGEIFGEIVVCGGPVSNLQATKALVEAAGGRMVICTGDLAAYCGDPAATVALIQSLGWPVVAGNCERQLAESALDCGCGFDDDSQCDLLSGAWYAVAQSGISDDQKVWMQGLPDAITFQHLGKRHVVLHGGWTAINRFIWPSDANDVFQQEISAIERDIGEIDAVICGHSGIAFERVIDGKVWLNAGTIGMPPHDGRPLTRYAVLHPDGARIERLSYDVEAAQSAMRAVGLTGGYLDALESGIWPSEDVLPKALQR